ncbi:MAG TPA: hypothetical protein VFK37_08135 [Bacillales bacterium]|nr:hypothetical protein [Bacillales bacterium]
MTYNTGKHNKQKTIVNVRSSGRPSEENGVTRVDLSKYEFSPPGPMGWTAQEYEKMIEKLQNMKEE